MSKQSTTTKSTRINKTVKLTKIQAGLYETRVNGRLYEVSLNNERGSSWYGQWIIRSSHSYSDPIRTLKECKAALQDMMDHPEKYMESQSMTIGGQQFTLKEAEGGRWVAYCDTKNGQILVTLSATTKATAIAACREWAYEHPVIRN